MPFTVTPAHVAAMKACDAWDALCESNGDSAMDKPAHVLVAIALLDTLEESDLDSVAAAARAAPAVSLAEFGPFALSPESRSDLAEIEASESRYARDLAAGLREWLAGRDHAPARVIASARLLDSNAALSRGAHAVCAASLARADASHVERATRLRDAAALSLADRTQLRGSPFPAARIAARYLEAFHGRGDVTDLAAAIDSLCALERQACEKAGQLRDADERSHSLSAALAEIRECVAKVTADSNAYREQRDSEGARAVAAEARAEKAERQLAEYRSLIGRVTYGAGLRDDSIMALGRAYLADAESAE